MKNFSRQSQRTAFTGAMTFLATLTGTAMAAYELRGQSDLVVDVIKIGSVLAVGTAIVSYVVWSVIHLRKNSLVHGGLAGLITAFTIIPLPVFASAFKTSFLENNTTGETGYLLSALDAITPAMKTGLLTFQVLTKVSLIALTASLCLGMLIARFVPSERDET